MIPLIVDTDPGVDDAFALAVAAGSPEVELRAVTTVFGNVPVEATTRNALRLLALCGRDDVPVAAGAGRPLVRRNPHGAEHAHGADGLGGRAAELPEPARPAERATALELMARVLDAADQPVLVAAIGPLTNVALLLAAYPELAARIGRLVVMGGALAGGNITAAAEFNVWADPEAARRVLAESEVPVTLVPLDLTRRAFVDQAWLAGLAGAGPVGEALAALTPPYREHYRRMLGADVLLLHDAVALVEAVRPGTLECRPVAVDVECGLGPARGALVADTRLDVDDPAGRVVDVAVDADLDAVRDAVLGRVAGVRA